MARPPDLTPLAEHPAVDQSEVVFTKHGGHMGPAVYVTCPFCGSRRLIPMRIVRQQLARPGYRGACRPCYNSQPKARTFRTSRNPSGRRIGSNGYVCLGKNAIDDAELPMFDTMRGKGGFVMEHRWVMAKHLRRPLTSDELVDHMDGDKTNNAIENLRLYVRGRQQPGSAPGHGTYYHEWQMGLRRIAELEALLD